MNNIQRIVCHKNALLIGSFEAIIPKQDKGKSNRLFYQLLKRKCRCTWLPPVYINKQAYKLLSAL